MRKHCLIGLGYIGFCKNCQHVIFAFNSEELKKGQQQHCSKNHHEEFKWETLTIIDKFVNFVDSDDFYVAFIKRWFYDYSASFKEYFSISERPMQESNLDLLIAIMRGLKEKIQEPKRKSRETTPRDIRQTMIQMEKKLFLESIGKARAKSMKREKSEIDYY